MVLDDVWCMSGHLRLTFPDRTSHQCPFRLSEPVVYERDVQPREACLVVSVSRLLHDRLAPFWEPRAGIEGVALR